MKQFFFLKYCRVVLLLHTMLAKVSSAQVEDSLGTTIEAVEDDSSTEEESISENSNKIIITVDTKSHNSFRGRDGGVSQASVSPSLMFALTSGFRVSLGGAWTEKPEFHQDGTYLGVGYDFNVLPIMSATIGYSYLWYSDSSTQNQSVFHHSIDGGIFLETSLANLSAGFGISIGSEMEYAFALSASRSFPIGNMSLDPLFTISWGEQNGALIAERITKIEKAKEKSKGKGTGVVMGQQSSQVTTTTTPTNVFSIMSYEINLPLNIPIGKFTLTPSLSGIFPMNVIDGSRELPYLNAGLMIVYEFSL